jgi:hypothetical protein
MIRGVREPRFDCIFLNVLMALAHSKAKLKISGDKSTYFIHSEQELQHMPLMLLVIFVLGGVNKLLVLLFEFHYCSSMFFCRDVYHVTFL